MTWAEDGGLVLGYGLLLLFIVGAVVKTMRDRRRGYDRRVADAIVESESQARYKPGPAIVEQAHFHELLRVSVKDGWKIRILDEQTRKELLKLRAPCNLREALLQLTRQRRLSQGSYRVQGVDERGFAKHGVVVIVSEKAVDEEAAIH